MAQYNFRLFIKPTVIGQAIIDRLSPEGADRQALARRWLELGFALEQAGFRLDGATVYQGGRQVSFDTPMAVPMPGHWQQPPAAEASLRGVDVAQASVSMHPSLPTAASSTAGSVTAAAAAAVDAAPAAAVPASRPEVSAAPAPMARPAAAVDDMTDNLRNLSA